MEKGIIFTRYLYLKDEVELALLFSLLNKKDEAIYWAYELYYSGFEEDLWKLFFFIYYKFYATINPTFEMYLIKKRNELEKKRENKIIANVVNNFIIRNYNLDVFMMCKFKNISVTESYDYDINNIIKLLKEEKWNDIAKIILSIPKDWDDKNRQDILCAVYKHYSGNEITKKLLSDWSKALSQYNKKVILLSRIVHYYSFYEKKINIGKSLYICIDEKDIVDYETLETTSSGKAYKILQQKVKYSTNESSYIGLFRLEREKIENIKNIYLNDWLYYASFTPLWNDRIKKFGGKVDIREKKILFDSELMEEEFYNYYNYEPDEQKKEIQNKNIPEINKNKLSWNMFYKKYKTNNMIEFEFEI